VVSAIAFRKLSPGVGLGVLLAGILAARQGDLGRIDFPTSAPAEAQKHFLRGALLLHSFEYDDAAEEFREAQKIAPGFAMAYWGKAMTYNHPLWMEQDSAAARKVLGRLAQTSEARLAKAPTQREKMYLEAVESLYGPGDKATNDRAYAEAMRRLHEKFPEDENAAAFYALALLGTCEGQRDTATYMKAAAVAEEVFAKNPLHPGAVHYLIHSYDDPIHAPLGMRAARVYAKIAPAAGHALHMPSHIFFASGMWEEAAASNTAAWRASLDRAARKKLGPDDHNYHALFWLEYTDLQMGRYAEARHALRAMENDAAKSGSDRAKSHLAMMRAAWVVETRRFDDDVARALAGEDRGVALFAQGLAASAKGDQNRLEKAAAAVGGKTPPGHTGGSMYRMGQASGASADAVMKKELEALLASLEKNGSRALTLAKEAADAEDSMSFEFGPPADVKPAHELYGELLAAAGKPAEARAEFERSLTRAPNRALSLLGLARVTVPPRATPTAGSPRCGAARIPTCLTSPRCFRPPARLPVRLRSSSAKICEIARSYALSALA
jgi:tetratricopeptide (TPR) repeat protein